MITPFALFLISLGLIVILLGLSLLLTPSAASGGESISRSTRFFLIALRLAIGWHFMVEGLDKLNNPNWTGEHYLRSATGPLAGHFREVADEELLAKLTLTPQNHASLATLGTGTVGATTPSGGPSPLTAVSSLAPGRSFSLPPVLDREWQRYRDKIVEDFQLDENRATFAQIRLDQAKYNTLLWMVTPQPVDKLSPYVERPADMTVAERIAHYHQLVDHIEHVLATEVQPYGTAAENKLKQARDEADYIILGLKRDLAQQTESMKQLLRDALPPDQQRANLPPMPPPPMAEWTQLRWSDFIIPWGLTIVGGLLIVGLLTRPACLLGAVFLLMLYLSMIPLPGWPEPARTEGHYLFINKNFIEMLALLALMTTRSGRWFGLDAVFALMFGGRRKAVPQPRDTTVSTSRNVGKEARPVSAS